MGVAPKQTFNTAGVFADSTTVKAYPFGSVVDRTMAPRQASVAEGSTSEGTISLTGLEENTDYWIGAEVSSKWVYMHVRTGSASRIKYTVGASIASANTITLPEGDLIEVTGTTEIKKITASTAGRVVFLKMKESVKFVDGENLKLAGNFEATADDILQLVCDGTNWYEVGRNAN